MPTGAPTQARRRFLPPPVWRFAPRRLLHDAVTLTLMFGVLTLLAVAAAAGPLYAEAVSDAAVRLALESVPAGASAKTAPVVRLNGGIDPESRPWTDMLRSLEEIPGVGPARKRALLKRFGSLSRLRAAEPGEIEQTPGIGPELARLIHDRLHGESDVGRRTA